MANLEKGKNAKLDQKITQHPTLHSSDKLDESG